MLASLARGQLSGRHKIILMKGWNSGSSSKLSLVELDDTEKW
jgi:hypothetical protein